MAFIEGCPHVRGSLCEGRGPNVVLNDTISHKHGGVTCSLVLPGGSLTEGVSILLPVV